MTYSKLLIPEPPLQVLPGLAVAIGLNEAIILQQLHYWMDPRMNVGKDHEGRRWVYNTYDQWQDQFPFWSPVTIKRIILSLERTGMVDSTDTLNSHKQDRTKWYSINYDHPLLNGGGINVISSRADQLDPPSGSDRPALHRTETTPESTAEITLRDRAEISRRRNLERAFDVLWSTYPRKEHKAAALKAWIDLDPDEDLIDMIHEAVREQSQNNWAGREMRYIPLLASWLRGERWEDGIVSPAQTNGTVVRTGKHGQRVYSPDEVIARAMKEMSE